MSNFRLSGMHYAFCKIDCCAVFYCCISFWICTSYYYYSLFKFYCMHADIFLSFPYVLLFCIKYCSVFWHRAVENCPRKNYVPFLLSCTIYNVKLLCIFLILYIYIHTHCIMTCSISSRSLRLVMDLMELNKLNRTELIVSTVIFFYGSTFLVGQGILVV